MQRTLRHLIVPLVLIVLASCVVIGGQLPREALGIPRGVAASPAERDTAKTSTPAPELTIASATEIVAAPVRPTASASPTPTCTSTASATLTPTHTATVTPTPSPAATGTASATPQPTVTGTPTSAQAPAADGEIRKARVPILMYHYISEPPPGSDIYRKDLSVAPQRFESHLRHLQDAGYHVVTLDDLLHFLTTGSPLPPKPIVLTFDDGYLDNYSQAFPLLQQYGMIGHFFIITDFVEAERPGYMNWAQIEEMSAAGQLFGAHSRNHADLSGRDTAYLVWHALGNLETIQQHLGYHPRWIAYPSGSYDARTTAVFKSANYWGGLSTQQGATHTLNSIFELQRIRVRGRHTAEDLEMLLNIDW